MQGSSQARDEQVNKQLMKRDRESTERTTAKSNRGRGLKALMIEGVALEKTLPQDVRADLLRLSKSATELVIEHMSYAEAREVMRHGWPSQYFGHLQRIAKKAKL